MRDASGGEAPPPLYQAGIQRRPPPSSRAAGSERPPALLSAVVRQLRGVSFLRLTSP